MPIAFRNLINIFSSVELMICAWMSSFTIIIVLDDKGGVGKSIITQAVYQLLLFFDFKVALGDTDTHNSTSAQTSEGAHMLDLRAKTSEGRLLRLLNSAFAKQIDHIVIDVGAREEAEIQALLPKLVEAAHKMGGRVVVVRPITLGSHNQRNAIRFMAVAEALRIPTVFVRNEGQGRRPEFFDRWIASESRANALARGAVETVLTDADVRYADEAVGLELSFADCALQDWTKLMPTEGMTDEQRKYAEQDVAHASSFFSDDVAAFLGEWLRINMRALGDAIEEAIATREALDAASGEGEQAQTRKAKRR